jgi:hypothetical protein
MDYIERCQSCAMYRQGYCLLLKEAKDPRQKGCECYVKN